MTDHKPECPRAQFWDAGDWECPCTCDQTDHIDEIIEKAVDQVPDQDDGTCYYSWADLRAVCEAGIEYGHDSAYMDEELKHLRSKLARELLDKTARNMHEPDAIRFQDLCGWLREIAEEGA